MNGARERLSLRVLDRSEVVERWSDHASSNGSKRHREPNDRNGSAPSWRLHDEVGPIKGFVFTEFLDFVSSVDGADIVDDRAARGILAAIFDIARTLELAIIAEGIETSE